MSEWKKVRIGDVAQIYDGPHATPPPCEKSDAYFLGIPHITPSGHIDLTQPRYIAERDYAKWTKRVVPTVGDVVFSYEATLNLYARIPRDLKCCLGRRMGLVRPDGNKLNDSFLYYYFFSEEWRKTVRIKTINGATVDRLPIADFPDFEISLPPLATQRRIASVLSNYDSAIANCRRQIALLEEAAMRLYKEWFKDGKGEMKTLGDLIEQRHKPVSKKGRDNYPCYIPIDQLPQHSLVCLNKKPVQEAESSLISFSKGDVIFGAMRPYFHKVVVATSSGLTRSTCFVLNSKQKEYHAWMICTLFSEETIRFATSISVGATMPYVRWNDLSKMRIVVPSIEAAYKFNQLLDPYWQGLTLLANQIRALTEARDRILPKLMKGEIAV